MLLSTFVWIFYCIHLQKWDYFIISLTLFIYLSYLDIVQTKTNIILNCFSSIYCFLHVKYIYKDVECSLIATSYLKGTLRRSHVWKSKTLICFLNFIHILLSFIFKAFRTNYLFVLSDPSLMQIEPEFTWNALTSFSRLSFECLGPFNINKIFIRNQFDVKKVI